MPAASTTSGGTSTSVQSVQSGFIHLILQIRTQNRRHPSHQRGRLPRRPPRRLPTTVPSPRGLEDFKTSAKIVGILHTEREGRLPGTASITTTSSPDEETSKPRFGLSKATLSLDENLRAEPSQARRSLPGGPSARPTGSKRRGTPDQVI